MSSIVASITLNGASSSAGAPGAQAPTRPTTVASIANILNFIRLLSEADEIREKLLPKALFLLPLSGAVPALLLDRVVAVLTRVQHFLAVRQHDALERHSGGAGVRGISTDGQPVANGDRLLRPAVSGEAQQAGHFHRPGDMLTSLVHDIDGHHRV